VVGLHFCWGDVANFGVEASVVEPFDVDQGGQFDVVGVTPWSLAFD